MLRAVARGLQNYDLDPGAAWLTQVLLDVMLLPSAEEHSLPQVIEVRDALAPDLPTDRFDPINPPYG